MSDFAELRRSKTEFSFEPKGENHYRKVDLKRHHSTRRLSRKLTETQYPASSLAVRQCLKIRLKLKPFKLRMQPLLTKDQKCGGLDFAKVHKNWTILDWGRVLFQ